MNFGDNRHRRDRTYLCTVPPIPFHSILHRAFFYLQTTEERKETERKERQRKFVDVDFLGGELFLFMQTNSDLVEV